MERNKKCACCGELSLESGSKFEICENCGWQDDDIQNSRPDYRGGANKMSLNEARQKMRYIKRAV